MLKLAQDQVQRAADAELYGRILHTRIFIDAPWLGRLPVSLVLPLSATEGEKDDEDTSRSGKRAGRPPASPAFPIFQVHAKALARLAKLLTFFQLRRIITPC